MTGNQIIKKYGNAFYSRYRASVFGNSILKRDESVKDVHYDENIIIFKKLDTAEEEQ